MSKTINLYRIDQENYHFNECKGRVQIIEHIINAVLRKYNDERKLSIKDISTIEKDKINYYLFVHNFSDKNSDWNTFFPPALSHSENFEISYLSLILFIDDGTEIYLIVGGKAYHAVVPFIDHSFGLLVASKIIVPEKDSIVSINSRGLTGSRSGMSEQYRNEFKIVDYARFGKVPTEFHLILCKETSKEHFSFLLSKNEERVKIHAGKFFKIKKNFNFEILHNLVKEMEFVMEKAPNDYLSTYIEIRNNHKKNKVLKPLLIDSLYNELGYIGNASGTNDKRFKFDFCNPNKMREFYEADYYILKEKVEKKVKAYKEFGKTENREDIYELVMKRALNKVGNNNKHEFRKYIQGIRVLAYNGKKKVTSSTFLYHFTAEFSLEGKSVFLVDTKWYVLNNSFIDDLKNECVSTIKNHRLPNGILDLPWDKTTIAKEADYNLSYNGKSDYIVLDTFVPEGIELCDILCIKTDIVYLIHVKYGFDASMRELGNQIELSARRLQTAIKENNNSYLNKIYERAKDRTSLSKSEFIALFKEKRIVYVFAFASPNPLLVENHINRYRSNIARYSLVQCNKNMQAFNFELNIHQIRKE